MLSSPEEVAKAREAQHELVTHDNQSAEAVAKTQTAQRE
jgi:hypothetical protein